eukprot:COSAG03_NODE_624_length_6664_cov_102.394973_6_plen_105_part_00
MDHLLSRLLLQADAAPVERLLRDHDHHRLGFARARRRGQGHLVHQLAATPSLPLRETQEHNLVAGTEAQTDRSLRLVGSVHQRGIPLESVSIIVARAGEAPLNY